MAAMVIVMVVFLVMAGSHGHMGGSHGVKESPPAESSQPRDAAQPQPHDGAGPGTQK